MVQNILGLIINMYQKFDHSDDSYSAPDPLPSPGEFSHLTTEPDLQDAIYR
jgi:hypothetical protein